MALNIQNVQLKLLLKSMIQKWMIEDWKYVRLLVIRTSQVNNYIIIIINIWTLKMVLKLTTAIAHC